MSSHSEQYVSSSTFPPPHGLHSIASFNVLQTETLVVAQQAKRRGGPKKVWLNFSVVDARGRTLSEHTLVWKCITQKNFSNQNNIAQYVRNPFGAVRMAGLSGGSELMLVVHGAVTQSKVSNTVGVNVAGRAVDQHPRFLLSSGKGAEGARSAVAVFHSDKHARVQLQSLTIEHRELKITFEQIEDRPMLEFAPKFKTTYTAKENTEGDAVSAPVPAPAPAAAAAVRMPRLAPITSAASSAMVDDLPAAAAAPVLAPSTSKSGRSRTVPARFSSEESAPQSRRPSVGRRLSALPPAIMPAAVAERLAKRKRSLATLDVTGPAAAAAAASATLDSPKAAADTSAPMPMDLPESPQPPPLESAAAAAADRSPKRSLFGSPAPAFAAAHFSGFDAELDFSSQETEEMLDVSDGQLQGQLGESDDGGDSPDSADATPRIGGLTPPPFMHGLGFSDDAAHGQGHGHSAADANDDLTMMTNTLEEAEGRCSRSHSDDFMDSFGLSSGLPSYLRPKRQLAAAAAESTAIPAELAAASSKDGSVSFSVFGAGPQQLSPGLNGYHSPPPFGLSGLDLNGLPRSPLSHMSLHDSMASPLPPLNLAPCPSSPMPAFAASLGDQSLPNFCRPQRA